jgi:hypothetical protein
MIQNFPTMPRFNVAGLLSSFQFIPSYYVSSWPQLNEAVVSNPVPLFDGISFLKGISTLEKLVFEEESAQDVQGTVYNWKITGFYPGDEMDCLSLFSSMSKPWITYLVVVQDIRRHLRLVGYKAPLTFNAVYSSGAVPGEAKGYTFTFTGTGLDRAPRYEV